MAGSDESSKKYPKMPEGWKAFLFTEAGVAGGMATVAASGMTAVGAVGGGAGIGVAAGPVGVVLGGLFGLAMYGLMKAFGK